MNDYIELGPTGQHKKYKVVSPEYKKQRPRRKTIIQGLSGKHIIQDFTVNSASQVMSLLLRAYATPTGNEWGSLNDLYSFDAKLTIDFIDFDGLSTTVSIESLSPPEYRVYANIDSPSSIAYIGVKLIEVNI